MLTNETYGGVPVEDDGDTGDDAASIRRAKIRAMQPAGISVEAPAPTTGGAAPPPTDTPNVTNTGLPTFPTSAQYGAGTTGGAQVLPPDGGSGRSQDGWDAQPPVGNPAGAFASTGTPRAPTGGATFDPFGNSRGVPSFTPIAPYVGGPEAGAGGVPGQQTQDGPAPTLAGSPNPSAQNGTNNYAQAGDTPSDTFKRNTTPNAATGAGALSQGTTGVGNSAAERYARGEIDYPTLQRLSDQENANAGSFSVSGGNSRRLPDAVVQTNISSQLRSLAAANGGDMGRALQAFLNPAGGARPDGRAAEIAQAMANGQPIPAPSTKTGASGYGAEPAVMADDIWNDGPTSAPSTQPSGPSWTPPTSPTTRPAPTGGATFDPNGMRTDGGYSPGPNPGAPRAPLDTDRTSQQNGQANDLATMLPLMMQLLQYQGSQQQSSNRNAQISQLFQSLIGQGGGTTSANTFSDPTGSRSAANASTGTVSPMASANVTGIDPNNDLRDKMITPATDGLTEEARQHMADAQNNLSSFDRAKFVQDAMKSFAPGGAAVLPTIAPGDDLRSRVIADVSDPRTIGYENQVDNAAYSLNGKTENRAANANSLADQFMRRFGNTDVQAGAGVDPGKDVSGLLDQSDANSMNTMGQVQGTDRRSTVDALLKKYNDYLGNTDVQAGPNIDVGKDVSGLLDQADSGFSNSLSRLHNTDRQASVDALMKKYNDYLGNTNVQAQPGIDVGKDVSGQLDSADANVAGSLAQLRGTDRQGMVNDLRKQYSDYLGNTNIQARPDVDVGADVSGMQGQADAGVMGSLGRVQGADRQSMVDAMMKKYADMFGDTNVQGGPAIGTAPSDRMKALQGQVDSATTGLSNIDRVKQAHDLFDQFSESSAPEYDLALKKATQRAAAAGGLGSGGLRTDYGNLALTRSRDLDLQKRQLITQAMNDSVNDALNKQGRLASLEGQLSGQEAGLRGEQRQDRAYQTDVNTGNVNRAISTKQAGAGMAASNADANIQTLMSQLSANQNVASSLAARGQQRTANQAANRDYATNVDTGNVNRALSAREAASNMASSNADANLSSMLSNLSSSQNVASSLAQRQQQRTANQAANRDYSTNVDTGNVNRGISARQSAAGLASSNADSNLQSMLSDLAAQQNASSALAGRAQQRTANQAANRDYATNVATGNTNRALSARESASNMASSNADSELQSLLSKLSASQGMSGALAGRAQQRTSNQMANRDYASNIDTGNVNRRVGLGQAAANYGADMAGNQVADARNNLSTLSGLEDKSRANNLQSIADLRGERANQFALGDRVNQQFNNNRDFASNFATQKAGDLSNALSGASNVFGQTANQEAQNRAELRGERTYQTGQEQSAFERAVAQRQDEQQAQKDRFSQGLALINAGGQGNPASTLANLGASSGMDASTIAKFAAMLGKGNATAGGSATPGGGDGGGSSMPAGMQSILDSIFKNGIPGMQTTGSKSGTNAGTNADGIDIAGLMNLFGGH